jgi:hypothetical protein
MGFFIGIPADYATGALEGIRAERGERERGARTGGIGRHQQFGRKVNRQSLLNHSKLGG